MEKETHHSSPGDRSHEEGASIVNRIQVPVLGRRSQTHGLGPTIRMVA